MQAAYAFTAASSGFLSLLAISFVWLCAWRARPECRRESRRIAWRTTAWCLGITAMLSWPL